LLTLALPHSSQAQAHATGEDSARAIHLLNRATFGIRAGDLTAVLSTSPDAWLERQLHPDRIPDTLARTLSEKYPVTVASVTELYRDYAPPSKAKSAAGERAMVDTMSDMKGGQRKGDARARGRSPQAMLAELASAKLERAALSDRQLEEVMTDFWFNHFNVFFQKGADKYLVSDYERSAIRPHVFGKFEDMLVATAQHPAMLFYLDNWQSVHVDSTMRARMSGQPTGKNRTPGLNENYARELLELHTLGVDGGYTQQDVVNVARALTGWTFMPPRPGAGAPAARRADRGRPGGAGRSGRSGRGDSETGFIFREQLHDRGPKLVLGHQLPAGRGIEDGREVLHIVATHPATAHFIASKLVEYFVNDSPPPALVDHIAVVFQKSGGDLRAVTRTLFSDPLFYAAENRGAKVKTPFQLVASALRVTNARIVNPRGAVQTLKAMGHLPYMSSPPTGYPAMSADWVNSGALLARMNFGIDYAAGKMPGVMPNAQSVLGSPAAVTDGRSANGSADALHAATSVLLPGVDASRLEKTIAADIQAQHEALSTPRAKAARVIGLVLGSPEFQRH
jgi:uncharacterized protein (DUF1800 family)